MTFAILRGLLACAVLVLAGCAGSGGGRGPASGSPAAGSATGSAAGSAAPTPASPGDGWGIWGTASALDSLRAGGVAVLGAVQVNEVDQVRPPLIAALDSVLGARWPGVHILRYPRVRAALDDSTARLLLLGYQLHGRAEPLWLDRAADSLGRDSVRYGVLARVRGQRLRTDERDGDLVDESNRTVKIRVTTRESDVSMHLYDLVTGGLRFSGEFRGFAERAASSDSLPPPELPPIRTWSTPEDRALEPMTPRVGGFPAPPSLDRAVADAIMVFADSLIGSAGRVGAETGGR